MKNLVVVYTRVSSDKQINNMSLSEQGRHCRNFVAQSRELADTKVDKIFIKEGESAKTADRTKLKEMLEYCRENKDKVGHVVVYKLDRMAVRKAELEREELKTDELDKEKIVDDAVRFVAHAGDIWRTAKAENKMLFQKLVYETV